MKAFAVIDLAQELAAWMESQPMMALGVALMKEHEFLAAAARAKRLLMARAVKAGTMTAEEADNARA